MPKINQHIVNQVNEGIFSKAHEISTDLLTGSFRSLFQVEKAIESSEPKVFEVEDDPQLIWLERMSPSHARYFPQFVALEEILAKRFQETTDYTFIVVADLSRSMRLKWRGIYENTERENSDILIYESTKLYLLKYMICSFFLAAEANGYSCKLITFGGNQITLYNSYNSPDFAYVALEMIDEHYYRLAEQPQVIEECYYVKALEYLTACRFHSYMALWISDFMDLLYDPEKKILPEMMACLTEIHERHRIATIQVNDLLEMDASPRLSLGPECTAWSYEIEKNPEKHPDIMLAGQIPQTTPSEKINLQEQWSGVFGQFPKHPGLLMKEHERYGIPFLHIDSPQDLEKQLRKITVDMEM